MLYFNTNLGATPLSLIHGEAQQKRKQGNPWDRVEGRIESLIQGRVRSRDRGGPDR